MKRFLYFQLALFFALCTTIHAQVAVRYETVINEQDTSSGSLIVHLSPDYNESIVASSITANASAGIMLSEGLFSEQPKHKNDLAMFTTPVTITYEIRAQDQQAIVNATIQLEYLIAPHNASESHILAIADNIKFSTWSENAENVYFPLDTQTAIDAHQDPVTACQTQAQKISWSESLSQLILHTDSLIIRLLFVLLLGLLMSLTPCIYPMIPITAGILQSQASKSIGRNIAVSCAYTAGIALTFALLGLTAAYTGQIFGSILANPIVIGAIVIFLGYLALSMMGLYEMYIPRFMQPRQQKVKQGSLLSAFIFGAASGTFASPCLSPGLLLLLTLVTSLQNAFLGFLLLFTFGIGLSIPLLLVGSFSSSMSMLPRAGMWMVEVKKLFGVLMLLMCLYFLSYVLSTNILLIITAALMLALAIWFYKDIKPYDKRATITYKYTFALLALIASGLSLKSLHTNVTCPVEINNAVVWNKSLSCAIEQATKENKKLFIDVGAPFCSICKAIDKKLLERSDVACVLQAFVLVKLDGSAPENKQFTQEHAIMGFPAIMITDATGTRELKRWGAELYTTKAEDFITQLQSHI